MNRVVHMKLDFSVVLIQCTLEETLLYEYGALNFSYSNLSYSHRFRGALTYIAQSSRWKYGLDWSCFPVFWIFLNACTKVNGPTISAHCSVNVARIDASSALSSGLGTYAAIHRASSATNFWVLEEKWKDVENWSAKVSLANAPGSLGWNLNGTKLWTCFRRQIYTSKLCMTTDQSVGGCIWTGPW